MDIKETTDAIEAVELNILEMSLREHSLLPDIERKLMVEGIVVNSALKEMTLSYAITYSKNSRSVNMVLALPEWKVTINDTMMLRDENFIPVTERIEGVDRVVMVNAYKYITFLLRSDVNLFTILTAYTQEQAAAGFFDL